MLTRKAATRVTLLAAPLACLLCRPVAVAAATPSDADNSTANLSDNPTAYSGGSQYKVTDWLKLYFNVKNLTNTPLKFTEGPGPNRVIQREFYDTTLQFGGILNF